MEFSLLELFLKGRDYNTNDKGQENYRNVRNQSADYWRTKIS